MNQRDYAKWVRFSVPSHIYLPIYSSGSWEDQRMDCTVWARWNEASGTLWIEAVLCEATPYDSIKITYDAHNRFLDRLMQELCTTLF